MAASLGIAERVDTFSNLQPNAGAEIIEAGASDWVVFPINNKYQEDESYFLHFIIDTFRLALKNAEEITKVELDFWINARHEQIDQGELVYIAHQIDFLGRMPGNRCVVI